MNIEHAFPRIAFNLFGIGVRDTVVVTWGIMIAATAAAWLGTRRLSDRPGPIQNALEAAVELVAGTIKGLTPFSPDYFLPLIGTLAVFLVACNSVSVLPRVGAPTRDINTTAALAAIVFFSVHAYGIWLIGARRYFRNYLEPFWLLLPFNVIGELTRTVALAVRLFGNVLSGEVIVAILLLLAGFLVPVPMQLFGLFIGVIQAYVFSLLTMIFIAAGLGDSDRAESTNGGNA